MDKAIHSPSITQRFKNREKKSEVVSWAYEPAATKAFRALIIVAGSDEPPVAWVSFVQVVELLPEPEQAAC